ncbi:MAG: potassium/proton antiporter [Burkholderiaceae bacterium]|nr:potassium/proton antiporter [Burkholderiaceae bacterium]
MDFVNVPLLAAAALVFTSVLAGLFSARIGFSFLLVFLLAGIVAGEDGPGGLRFDNYVLVFWVGNVALAVILLDGGLRTTFATFRTGLKPAAVLATLGVVISAVLTGLAAMLLLGLDWATALLLGAIVGSTDAAAVFSLLTRSGVTLNERVAATLEIESGVNDPMAIYLTVACIGLITALAQGQAPGAEVLTTFVAQFGWGALMGLAGGWLMAALLRRIAARDAGGGILALLLVAGGLSVFAATGTLDGSGFLAAYLFGMIVANRAADETAPTLAAMDGYAWLAQAGMFLLLGLLVTPTDLLPALGPSLALAAVLIFVARPAAVWLCLWPFRFTRAETAFIAWVGLRGAVPIVLALFPLLAGVPQAQLLFNTAFVVVLVSLLLQGSTIGWVARRLGVALPDRDDTARARLAFGDFALDPRLPVGAICQFYGLTAPEPADARLDDWMATAIGRPPVVGDRVALGTATLFVRELDRSRITGIGLALAPEA